MKFTLSWLKDHLKTDKSVQEIADAMTMAGLEVEHVRDPAAALAAFSVAYVQDAQPHPNADRLKVCAVETKDGVKQIVCGAPNARAGLHVVYAPVGAYVPGIDVTLKQAQIRGVESQGMMCSASELLLGEDHSGIIELQGAPAVGTPAAEALAADPMIDFEVTPNRPDWLGVRGIARDLAAAGAGELFRDDHSAAPGHFDSPIQVTIEAPDACPVFLGRYLRGVKNGPSPAWLQQRLRAIGLRPINALVDITNYLSYDRARPLHVFDAAKLSGTTIVARLARDGEALAALDGKTYALDDDMCVIADASGPLGLGGVMGGEASGVSDATTDLFIECAYFDPARTARTGRRTGIVSDARYRFERGVDTGFLTDGLELATSLALEFCGGEASHIVHAGEIPEAPAPVEFDLDEVRRLTGMELKPERILEILHRLGFGVAGSGHRVTVQPPSWRRDITQSADLVEEVARIQGFDALPATPLRPEPGRMAPVYPEGAERARRARRALAADGWLEAVTWSFCRAEHAKLFGGAEGLEIANPVSSELSTMRPTPLAHLIPALQWNADRGSPYARLFEVGPAWTAIGDAGQARVAAGAVRAEAPRSWTGAAEADVFAMKSAALLALEAAGAPVASLQTAANMLLPWQHPGRSGVLVLGNKPLARFGEVHPVVLRGLDVAGRVLAFEIYLDAIPPAKKKGGKTRPPLVKADQTPIVRDFAFIKDTSVSAESLVRAAAGADKALIDSVIVFDVYEGTGLPEGKNSIAIAVRIQPVGKPLTDAEIEALSKSIIGAVEKATGATLRG
jgi:phenylalanyl-tRNA synthetase beta chain